MTLHRRSFLKLASLAAAGNAAAMNPFGNLSALAQSSSGSDYKALVCILLQGGNDGNNMLVPGDTAGYTAYASARQSLALPRSSLLGLNGATNLTLHPSMPEVQQLFQKNKAAFLLNTGSLVAPLTRAEYLANNSAAGSSLFSHYDQTNFLQAEHALSPDPTGWGGRIADAMQSTYGTTQLPTVVSVSGSHIFGNGRSTQGYAVTPGTAGALVGTCWETSYCADRLSTAQQLLTMSSGATLVQSDGEMTAGIYQYATNLASAVNSAGTLKSTLPAGNPLTSQLQQILQIMQVRSYLGARRQIFFATLGGFDTHSSQLGQQTTTLDNLSAALGGFYESLEEMGLGSQVTSFTVSDFGRALQGNSQAGSDHAWGSHHIVVGDAVSGGKTYGTFPNLTLGGPDDAGSTGRWIPTTSTTQYAATLASWFGVTDADMATVFPLSSQFAQKNLGFMSSAPAAPAMDLRKLRVRTVSGKRIEPADPLAGSGERVTGASVETMVKPQANAEMLAE